MPSPSATWTTRQVHITYRSPLTGQMEPGSWSATSTGRITNTLSDGTKQVFRAGRVGTGNLNTSEGLPSLAFDMPVVDDPDNSPQGGEIVLTVTFLGGGSEVFHISPLTSWPSTSWPAGGTDLALILDPTIIPSAPLFVTKGVPGGVAELDADGDVIDADGVKVVAGGGGGGGPDLTNYSQVSSLTGYPTAFPPILGTTGGVAKAGDYQPVINDISNATSIGRALLAAATAAAGRTAIGAGISDLTIGITGSTAKAGDYAPTWSQVSAKPAFIAAGVDAAAARAAIGFDAAARVASPFGFMWWNTSTDTWWVWDPTTNAAVNGGPRPAVPVGFCFYDAVLYADAILPVGAQAMLFVSNGPGDKIWLHKDSALWP